MSKSTYTKDYIMQVINYKCDEFNQQMKNTAGAAFDNFIRQYYEIQSEIKSLKDQVELLNSNTNH